MYLSLTQSRLSLSLSLAVDRDRRAHEPEQEDHEPDVPQRHWQQARADTDHHGRADLDRLDRVLQVHQVRARCSSLLSLSLSLSLSLPLYGSIFIVYVAPFACFVRSINSRL